MRSLDGREMTAEQVAAKLARDRAPMNRAFEVARAIVDDVQRRGDAALLDATERFEGVRPNPLVLSRADLEAALGRIPSNLRSALEFAARQIGTFHRRQLPLGFEVSIGPGGSCAGEQPRALRRVGVYVPGGPSGYPSSALMGTIPARIAGVREIIVATLPSRGTARPPDAVLAAAALGGAEEVLIAGGAQAIAAMAYGTESVRSVDKIVGPGNLYVTVAKLLVADAVSTDGVAGPSEVLVIADGTLTTEAFAAELLAQGEHDPDAVAIGVVLDDRDCAQLGIMIEERASALPRGREALAALRKNGWLVRAASVGQAIEIANAIAPEHLVLAVQDARSFLYAVQNAGAVFLGPWAAAAFGDYVAGTNHILPTAGTARCRGGLAVRDFVKYIAYVEVSQSDAKTFADAATIIARAEGFEAHAAAAESRAPEAQS